jgi:hypothetical protein
MCVLLYLALVSNISVTDWPIKATQCKFNLRDRGIPRQCRPVSPIQCTWTCSSAYALALHAYVIQAVRQLLGKSSRHFLNIITGLATNSCIWTYWKLVQYKIHKFLANCGSSDPETQRGWHGQGFMRNWRLVEPRLLLMHQSLDYVRLKAWMLTTLAPRLFSNSWTILHVTSINKKYVRLILLDI